MTALTKGTAFEVIGGDSAPIGSNGVITIDEGEQEGVIRDVLCLIDGETSPICIKTNEIAVI